MSVPSSPKATPKRKRDDLISEQKLAGVSTAKILPRPVFTFEPPSLSQSSAEDGSSSPRTKVANKLRDLSLNRSGGGAATTSQPDGSTTSQQLVVGDEQRPKNSPDTAVFDFGKNPHQDGSKDNMEIDQDDESAIRKRHKHQEPEDRISPGINSGGDSSADAAGPVQVDEHGRLTLDRAVDPNMIKIARRESTGSLKKSYPSINRLTDSKSRNRRRSGTPPLIASRRRSTGTIDDEPIIVDPVRAALTWHEDEITVYDSEDKDDDGTGLNGIGFRPTPAIAHQRAQQRKKQLSEYKKREESEARALRNQRRREALGGGSQLERHHSVLRVHFSEAEPETLVTS